MTRRIGTGLFCVLSLSYWSFSRAQGRAWWTRFFFSPWGLISLFSLASSSSSIISFGGGLGFARGGSGISVVDFFLSFSLSRLVCLRCLLSSVIIVLDVGFSGIKASARCTLVVVAGYWGIQEEDGEMQSSESFER